MANIDPELQDILNAIFLSFTNSCNRIRDEATIANLELADMAFDLDSEARKDANEIAAKAFKMKFGVDELCKIFGVDESALDIEAIKRQQ